MCILFSSLLRPFLSFATGLLFYIFYFLNIQRHPISTRTFTLFPYSPFFRSRCCRRPSHAGRARFRDGRRGRPGGVGTDDPRRDRADQTADRGVVGFVPLAWIAAPARSPTPPPIQDTAVGRDRKRTSLKSSP